MLVKSVGGDLCRIFLWMWKRMCKILSCRPRSSRDWSRELDLGVDSWWLDGVLSSQLSGNGATLNSSLTFWRGSV